MKRLKKRIKRNFAREFYYDSRLGILREVRDANAPPVRYLASPIFLDEAQKGAPNA